MCRIARGISAASFSGARGYGRSGRTDLSVRCAFLLDGFRLGLFLREDLRAKSVGACLVSSSVMLFTPRRPNFVRKGAAAKAGLSNSALTPWPHRRPESENGSPGFGVEGCPYFSSSRDILSYCDQGRDELRRVDVMLARRCAQLNLITTDRAGTLIPDTQVLERHGSMGSGDTSVHAS